MIHILHFKISSFKQTIWRNNYEIFRSRALTLNRESLGPSPSACSGKNNAALCFPYNTLGDGHAFWIFFQDSRIRVNTF